MDKSGSQLGIAPVAKVSPIASTATIGSAVQSLSSRASNLAQQQASLLAHQAHASLLPTSAKLPLSSTHLSPVAKLINQSLQQAAVTGTSAYYQAQAIVSHQPTHTMTFSQELSRAIAQSGLFYESHLAEFLDGHRSSTSIRQEAYNHAQQPTAGLLAQQLNVLEHQRISWHGEVWPNQLMEWHIQLPEKHGGRQSAQEIDESASQAVSTELKLALPGLGKVSATLRFVEGNVQFDLQADKQRSVETFKQHQQALLSAMQSQGLRVADMQVSLAEESA